MSSKIEKSHVFLTKLGIYHVFWVAEHESDDLNTL